MRLPKIKYTVYYRESSNSPQWEDHFEKGSNDENKAAAEKRAYEIMLDGGLAVVVPFIMAVPTTEIDESEI